jgi:hypothetical protein
MDAATQAATAAAYLNFSKRFLQGADLPQRHP